MNDKQPAAAADKTKRVKVETVEDCIGAVLHELGKVDGTSGTMTLPQPILQHIPPSFKHKLKVSLRHGCCERKHMVNVLC
eukprot:448251-Amphidinium_carterae.1